MPETLSFNAVCAKAIAAGSPAKGRSTTGKEYVGVDSGLLFRKMQAAGFACVDAMQGPSRNKRYVKFARHAMVFAPKTVDLSKPHFRVTVTNSHDGLTPLTFAPGWYMPENEATFLATSFVVFHRLFTDDGKFSDLIVDAMDRAIAAAPRVGDMWKVFCNTSLTPRQSSALIGSILNRHTGSSAEIPTKQVLDHVKGPAHSLAAVMSAAVGSYTTGKLFSDTANGPRRIYLPRAIVRWERVAYGAWFEAVAFLKRSANFAAPLPPVDLTPVERNEHGNRRKTGGAVITDKATPAVVI